MIRDYDLASLLNKIGNFTNYTSVHAIRYTG